MKPGWNPTRRIRNIKVTEAYKDYEPPFCVVKATTRALGTVPDEYLGGLGSIVLRNVGSLNRSRKRSKTRSRGRRVLIRKSAGLYHHRERNEPAWIELFVDNIFHSPILSRIPVIRDLVLASTLFHEIGHHIHRTKRREFKEPESVAEKWQGRLLIAYVKRRYWYCRPCLFTTKILLRPIRRPIKKLTRRFSS